MRNALAVLLAASLALAISSCSSEDETEGRASNANGRLSVFVSIPPQAYFAERIGGEHVAVEVLVGPGQTPHTFEPSMKQMVRLSKASLLLTIGVPFEEALVPKLAGSCPGLVVVDTSAGIELSEVETHAEEGHDHQHHSGELDPHIWLSPKLAKIVAENTCEALSRADPEHKDDYRKNLAALQSELDALHLRIAEALKPLKGRTLYVFHPAFGYFAREYGLKQEAVEFEGKSPSAKRLSELIARAKADGVKIIFVQPQFSDRAAKAVAQRIGGAVVPIDPLAKDYVKNLDNVAGKVREALGG